MPKSTRSRRAGKSAGKPPKALPSSRKGWCCPTELEQSGSASVSRGSRLRFELPQVRTIGTKWKTSTSWRGTRRSGADRGEQDRERKRASCLGPDEAVRKGVAQA